MDKNHKELIAAPKNKSSTGTDNIPVEDDDEESEVSDILEEGTKSKKLLIVVNPATNTSYRTAEANEMATKLEKLKDLKTEEIRETVKRRFNAKFYHYPDDVKKQMGRYLEQFVSKIGTEGTNPFRVLKRIF